MLTLTLNGYDRGHYPFKCKSEGGTYSFGAANGNRLFMSFENMFYDCKSQARATNLSRPALVGSVKTLK